MIQALALLILAIRSSPSRVALWRQLAPDTSLPVREPRPPALQTSALGSCSHGLTALGSCRQHG